MRGEKRGPEVQDKWKDRTRGLGFLKLIQASRLPDRQTPSQVTEKGVGEKIFLYWTRLLNLLSPSGSKTLSFLVFSSKDWLMIHWNIDYVNFLFYSVLSEWIYITFLGRVNKLINKQNYNTVQSPTLFKICPTKT